MPYRHRPHKNILHKAVSLLLEELPKQERDHFAHARQCMIDAANQMARAAFVADPLFEDGSGAAVDKAMLPVQSTIKTLTSCYIEAARMHARTAINNAHQKFLCCLVGRLAHVDSRITDDKRANEQVGRIFYNIPTAIQARVTKAELEGLKAVPATEDTGFADTVALFRRVLVERDTTGLTANLVAILAEIHRLVLRKHRLPVFGCDQRHVVQIHLNCHIIRTPRGSGIALQQLQQGGEAVIAKGKGFCQAVLYVSNPVQVYGKAVRLDLTLMAELATRLFKHPRDFTAKSLILEIGPDWVGVRVVTAKRKPAVSLADINQYPHLLADDFGYRHTGSDSVVRRDRLIEPAAAEYLQTLNKEETKQYYETHHYPMDQTVHQQHWGGKPFLDHVYLHTRKNDQLRSEIDRSYLRLERIKANLMGHMGLPKDAWVPEDWRPVDPVARRLHGRFFRLLANISHLKQLPLEQYVKIRAVKKSDQLRDPLKGGQADATVSVLQMPAVWPSVGCRGARLGDAGLFPVAAPRGSRPGTVVVKRHTSRAAVLPGAQASETTTA